MLPEPFARGHNNWYVILFFVFRPLPRNTPEIFTTSVVFRVIFHVLGDCYSCGSCYICILTLWLHQSIGFRDGTLWKGCARNQRSCGYQELLASLYTINMCRIRSCMTYLLSRTKRAGSPTPRSQCTLSRIRGTESGVVWKIGTSTSSPTLKFCIQIIYIRASLFPCLWANRACIACPVKVESRSDHTSTQNPEMRQRLWELQWLRLGSTLPRLTYCTTGNKIHVWVACNCRNILEFI